MRHTKPRRGRPGRKDETEETMDKSKFKTLGRMCQAKIAFGRVRVDKYGRKRIDIVCPYCGKIHSHGWTPPNLRRYSHCIESDPFHPVGGTYLLREAKS